MDAAAIFEALQSEFDDSAVTELSDDPGIKDPFCKVTADKLVEVALHLRDTPAMAFDFLQCVTAVDYPREEQICCVYHLYSYEHHHSFALKVIVPRDNPIIPSVVGVWATANWNEREQYDLFGVQFSGHPELRRLLLPDDWIGYPMRKDSAEAGDYRGMRTTRYSVPGMLAAYDKENPQTEGKRPYTVEEGDPQ